MCDSCNTDLNIWIWSAICSFWQFTFTYLFFLYLPIIPDYAFHLLYLPIIPDFAFHLGTRLNLWTIDVTGYFLTKIFHPNIATNGEICVNTLKKDWNPSLGLRHVLIVSTVWHFCVFEVKTFLFIHTGRAVFTIRIPPILFEIFGCKLGNFYFINFFYGNRWSGVCWSNHFQNQPWMNRLARCCLKIMRSMPGMQGDASIFIST